MADLKIEEVHILELYIPVGYPIAGSGQPHNICQPCFSVEAAESTVVTGDKRIFKIAIPMRYKAE